MRGRDGKGLFYHRRPHTHTQCHTHTHTHTYKRRIVTRSSGLWGDFLIFYCSLCWCLPAFEVGFDVYEGKSWGGQPNRGTHARTHARTHTRGARGFRQTGRSLPGCQLLGRQESGGLSGNGAVLMLFHSLMVVMQCVKGLGFFYRGQFLQRITK